MTECGKRNAIRTYRLRDVWKWFSIPPIYGDLWGGVLLRLPHYIVVINTTNIVHYRSNEYDLESLHYVRPLFTKKMNII